jgi:hypothetical protein
MSLGSFRGGPVFPAMFVGAAGGMAMSHRPGLQTVSGVAMGIGARGVVILGFPLVSVGRAWLGRAWLDPRASAEDRPVIRHG